MTDEEIDEFFKKNLSEIDYKRVTLWQKIVYKQRTSGD